VLLRRRDWRDVASGSKGFGKGRRKQAKRRFTLAAERHSAVVTGGA